jgi:hypothetical protein
LVSSGSAQLGGSQMKDMTSKMQPAATASWVVVPQDPKSVPGSGEREGHEGCSMCRTCRARPVRRELRRAVITRMVRKDALFLGSQSQLQRLRARLVCDGVSFSSSSECWDIRWASSASNSVGEDMLSWLKCCRRWPCVRVELWCTNGAGQLRCQNLNLVQVVEKVSVTVTE